jgi:hypothetical protein
MAKFGFYQHTCGYNRVNGGSSNTSIPYYEPPMVKILPCSTVFRCLCHSAPGRKDIDIFQISFVRAPTCVAFPLTKHHPAGALQNATHLPQCANFNWANIFAIFCSSLLLNVRRYIRVDAVFPITFSPALFGHACASIAS